ncbi:MAG: hypothetical protein ACXAD7_08095, partial [Candidatus Kariarchaeaceae archaeon]
SLKSFNSLENFDKSTRCLKRNEDIIARFILPSLNPSSDGNFIGYQYFGLYFPFLILVSLYWIKKRKEP